MLNSILAAEHLVSCLIHYVVGMRTRCVVFRHQARGAPEKKGRTFVNDTIRNDFHKRFLAKYIQ